MQKWFETVLDILTEKILNIAQNSLPPSFLLQFDCGIRHSNTAMLIIQVWYRLVESCGFSTFDLVKWRGLKPKWPLHHFFNPTSAPVRMACSVIWSIVADYYTVWRIRTWSTLVQVFACHRRGVESSPNVMLIYHRNKLQRYFDQDAIGCIVENEFENVICNMWAMVLSILQCVIWPAVKMMAILQTMQALFSFNISMFFCETAVSPTRSQWSVQLSIKIDFDNGLVSL